MVTANNMQGKYLRYSETYSLEVRDAGRIERFDMAGWMEWSVGWHLHISALSEGPSDMCAVEGGSALSLQ